MINQLFLKIHSSAYNQSKMLQIFNKLIIDINLPMSTVICTHCFLVMHIPCCEDRKVISSICQNCLLKIHITGEERCFQCGQHTSGTLVNIKNNILIKNPQKNIQNLHWNHNPNHQPRFDRNSQLQIPLSNLNQSNFQLYLENSLATIPIRMKEIHTCHKNMKGHNSQVNQPKHLFNQMQELTEEDIRMSNEVLSMPLNCDHRLIKERQKIGKAEFSPLMNQSPPPQFQNWQGQQEEAQSYTSSIYYSDSNY